MRKILPFLILLAVLPAPARGADDPVLAARKAFLAAKMAEADGRIQQALADFREAIRLRPEDPVLHYELALVYHRLQVDDEALARAREAAKLDPRFSAAWRLMGSIDLAAADKDRARLAPAIEELQKGYRLSPQNPSAALALVRAYLLDESPDKAREVLDGFAGADENPGFFKVFAQADDKRGADEAAARDYDRWLQFRPDDREAVAASIEFHESRQDFAPALDLLGQLEKSEPGNVAVSDRIALDLLRAGDFPGAEKKARELTRARPEDHSAWRTLALARYQQGDGSASEEILQKLIDQDPDDPSAVFTLALQRAGDGRNAAAVETLEALRARIGNDAARADLKRQVESEMAALHLRQKDTAQARSMAAAVVLTRDSVEDRALNVLLQIARDEKKPQEGLDWARKACALEPKNPDYSAARAEFEVRSGGSLRSEGEAAIARMAASGIAADVVAAADTQARLKDYAASARTAGEGAKRFAGNTDLLFRQGSALERLGRVEESEAVFRRILAIRPDDAQTLNYLGYRFADRGVRLEEARQMLEKAVALDPRNGAYLDSLGWVYFRLNDLEKARRFLTDASQRIPDDASIQEHMGDLDARMGQKDQALIHWRKSLTLTPDEPEKIEKKIREASSQP